ncbi:MAG: hypothetical protein GWP91_21525 [Rhodobacterales bacterium]|nr:hypothetical protein [Rhodobacterales bacterium]
MRYHVLLLAFVGCSAMDGGPGSGVEPDDTGSTITPTATTNPCTLGLGCNPIPVTSFPFEDARNTADAPGSEADSYSCAPDTDESGPEWFYEITVPEAGILSVRVDDLSGDAIDVDVHILATIDPNTCLTRHNEATGWVVEPGSYIATVDTWVNADGEALVGDYDLTVRFFPLDDGTCAVEDHDVRMFWSACGPGMDCDMETHTDGEVYPFVHTPSVGPLVKEAHLVTVGETFDGDGWPVSFTDQIDRHYSLTEAASGYEMDRGEPWAPDGEGGSRFGQGATGVPIPAAHETWYVNMYWRNRPAKGHKILLFNPVTGAAVVAAGGYETGPGSNESLAGATEEVHDALGTGHRDPVVVSWAVDQSLPYGPINCF